MVTQEGREKTQDSGRKKRVSWREAILFAFSFLDSLPEKEFFKLLDEHSEGDVAESLKELNYFTTFKNK